METCSLITLALIIAFFFGIAVFLEDASHVSKAYLHRAMVLMLGAANVGLGFAVFRGRKKDWMPYDYVLSMVWPMDLAMFGMLISHGNCKGGKVEIEKEKGVKD